MSKIPTALLRNTGSRVDLTGLGSDTPQGGVYPLQGGQADCIQMFLLAFFLRDNLFFFLFQLRLSLCLLKGTLIIPLPELSTCCSVLHCSVPFQSAFMLLTSVLS